MNMHNYSRTALIVLNVVTFNPLKFTQADHVQGVKWMSGLLPAVTSWFHHQVKFNFVKMKAPPSLLTPCSPSFFPSLSLSQLLPSPSLSHSTNSPSYSRHILSPTQLLPLIHPFSLSHPALLSPLSLTLPSPILFSLPPHFFPSSLPLPHFSISPMPSLSLFPPILSSPSLFHAPTCLSSLSARHSPSHSYSPPLTLPP